MKNKQNNDVVAKLNRIKAELGVLGCSESRAAFLQSLEELIVSLTRLRTELSDPSLEAKAAEVKTPLDQVIKFLELAQSDVVLQALLSLTGITVAKKTKRQAVEIPGNLTNEQIRTLLQKDLSKAELKAIAKQKSFPVGKLSISDMKHYILKNLERQEGYGRLGAL